MHVPQCLKSGHIQVNETHVHHSAAHPRILVWMQVMCELYQELRQLHLWNSNMLVYTQHLLYIQIL